MFFLNIFKRFYVIYNNQAYSVTKSNISNIKNTHSWPAPDPLSLDFLIETQKHRPNSELTSASSLPSKD